MRLTWSPATPLRARRLGDRLREEDYREVKTMTEKEPSEVLEHAVRRAEKNPLEECWIAPFGSHPGVIVGKVPTLGRGAKMWLLAAPEVQERPIAVYRDSVEYRDRWLEEHGYLWNVVDARNEMHVRWIEAAGFDLWRTDEINGAPFTYFDISEDDNV